MITANESLDVCWIKELDAFVVLTPWYPPDIKPVRSGHFLSQFFDAGWMYDWMVYWDQDRQQWLDREGGSSVIDQNLTWRGQTK